MKKVMHNTDKQYIRVINSDKNNSIMHNLKSNFDKFFHITKSFLCSELDDFDNLFSYHNKPKLSDCEIIALSITGESIGIDSENYFWGKLKADHALDFPHLIDRSNYNRRRRKLFPYIRKLNQTIANQLNEGEDVYLVDSIPIPVCQLARAKRSKICKTDYLSSPDIGYSAVTKSYYYGYKLHLVTSYRGVFQSMDLTKASVHDIHYLSDIKHSGLKCCTLIADKGYLSKPYQVDLFNSCAIKLETPNRQNQHAKEPFPFIFRKSRKRIETLFSQLCDQFMLKRNYAKTDSGVALRILSKVTAVTILQLINYQNNKPLNHLKYALAS